MDTYRFRQTIHRLPGKVIHHVPTPEPQVVEGHQSRAQIGEICRQCGYERVLLVTDQTLHKLGYDQAIMQSLDAAGVSFTLFADINSEPTIALIDAGREVAKICEAECVIALGGGSVLDTCKMIAAGMKLPHLSTKALLLKFLVVPGKTLPMISVPSTAGTGAEITVGAVVTNARGVKGSTVLVGLNVTHVILDSELTIHAPQMVTAACGMDALSHVVEGAISDVDMDEENMRLSMEGTRLILQHLPIVMCEPENIESRLAMCRAAMYGGNAINTQLAGYVHAFAHSIGAKYHLPHGQAITLMMMPVLEYQKEACIEKYAMLARYCQLADENTDEREAADKFLQAIAQLIVECGMDKIESPVQEADYKQLVRMIAKDSINYSAPMTYSNEDIEQVLKEVTVSDQETKSGKSKFNLKERWQRFKEWRERPSQMAPLSDEGHECECCHTNYQGNYCPRCGQSWRIGRYSFKTGLLGFLDVWGLGNRGMFRTIRDLILRPGYMIRDYLKGMQAAYFPPFKMFFVLALFSILVTHGFNIKGENSGDDNKDADSIEQSLRETEMEENLDDYSVSLNGKNTVFDARKGEKAKEIAMDILVFIARFNSRFPNIFSLLVLMYLSGVLYLFFRHSPNIPDLRFSEFFVSLVYTNNMYSIYSIVFGFFCLSTLASLSLLLTIIPLKQLYGYSWSRTTLKVVTAFLIMAMLFMLILFLFIISLVGYVALKY